ncbi:hypothetical protein, partial [Streptococcus sobrinus]|uniref:hypothetical protein n=1 Tax=Streptococcus sobrinus TaxID=1310 RepID=UPI0005178A8A
IDLVFGFKGATLLCFHKNKEGVFLDRPVLFHRPSTLFKVKHKKHIFGFYYSRKKEIFKLYHRFSLTDEQRLL